MSNLRTLVFFATPPHDCSYLPDREATTMFVDPRAHIDKSFTANSRLSAFAAADPTTTALTVSSAMPAYRFG